MSIEKEYLVEKRNVLNEIRSSNMTLQELRFFSIYLAKINSRKESTRVVRFPLEDFKKIMGIRKLNIKTFKHTINSLLEKVINITFENGGISAFQLFKECKIDKDENEEWYIEIDAHDKALPLMFDFKEKYFSYQLWNALRLKSSNQLRMYEILKQYENIGERLIDLNELKELLGLNSNEYLKWERFKIRVLESCKNALKENTDIYFDYQPIRRGSGKGGKINKVLFKIYQNNTYKDPLMLSDFINLNLSEKIIDNPNTEEHEYYKSLIELLSSACRDEFSKEEIKLLNEYIFKIIKTTSSYKNIDLERFHYLKRKYAELEWRANQVKISNRFAYLKKLVLVDIED